MRGLERFLSLAACFFLGFALALPPAGATKLPSDLREALTKMFPESKIRLDGALETKAGDLYIPLMAGTAQPIKHPETPLRGVYPDSSQPDLLSFSNGWFYLKVLKRASKQTLVVPADLPDTLRKSLLECKFAPDLIVPEDFVLPTILKPAVGQHPVTFSDVPQTDSPSSVSQPRKPRHNGPVHVGIFVSSPKAGKVSLLDENTFAKIAEFPTEGTPAGLAYADGVLYITDQSKHRVLKLDPTSREFIGQINLPPHSAPKGVAALPDGKLIYVSESATSSVAVIEAENSRLLVHTKVLTGPARLAVTPNGSAVVVLNAPAGKITIISTQNQKVLATVAVGALPNAIAISPNSERAYVSNRVSNTVSVVDLIKHQVVQTLKTGAAPTGLTLDETGERLFVANAKDNTISVFDLAEHKRLQDIKLPLDVDFPGALALLPNKHEILVSSEVTEAIGLLDTTALAFEKQPVIGYPSDEFLLVPIFSE